MNDLHQALLRAATLFFIFSAVPVAFAQGQPPQTPQPPPDFPNTTPRPPSIRERQIVMDEMTREAGKAPPRRSEELRMTEISEDYRELQEVNNKMMSAVMRTAQPDFDLIVKSVSEIRRRAERLRQNLALPAPELEQKTAPKSVEDTPAMKRSLLALDRSIVSFVSSPLFKNTDVLDAEAATKTARDLAEVIELSGRAAKDAERLRKKNKN